MPRSLREKLRRLDLQAKIILVLIAVIVPTFLVVTFAENQFTKPLLEDELRQVGVNTARTLGAEIAGQRLLNLANPTPVIEDRLQELLYLQPNINRIDVLVKDPQGPGSKVIASNVEEDPDTSQALSAYPITDNTASEFKSDDLGQNYWELFVPIELKGRDPHAPKRVLGTIHVLVSLKLVNRVVSTFWKTTGAAAGASVFLLIFVLSYFLRRTVENDRLLRQAETQNIQLTERLHDAQRQLMNSEKLAVMGQLTASFAHEIGTPLNAIGGHLQLLRDDLGQPPVPAIADRLGIITGQVSKIEQIVKNFLHSTTKPPSQRQLVDLNRLADQTLRIVSPRVQALDVDVQRDLDRTMGPLRAVPVEIEQILLNLVNNSLDSLEAKSQSGGKQRPVLEISTTHENRDGQDWAVVAVYDTGQGISKEDISKVLKPFYTTKPPGQGTGLGLTICQQLARKYGGMLEIESKEAHWTRVMLRLPYQVNA